MIIATGIDVVNIDRFAQIIEKNPAMVERLFVPHEREKTVRSLAARFAAKEAVAKALKAPAGMVWQHCWVENTADGAPHIMVEGTVAQAAASLGINRWHLTMTHDDPVAIASVVAEHLSQEELALLAALDAAPLGLVI
ncbi:MULTISPECIES: holo-ACP synthase [unclassified Rothia (in: high G+C Gram-positive bacteria)]|uniref:holo-ACP synthase n=1 Tax=unclassified Rothia (in: high G+C Gram-positive bacteria) TaxID=2689056 RepID=UPI00195CAA0B|nr:MULTISPECIES: holo-ACP synthase [unclassified Rothia (in: high G+C Gram-positive bacteria)]MBM7051189.1 holo-ACP synthase [Rothia sp. ZJ1223]QRZ62542.1 holo-ACP synthase [Rothia sp. ZJ932]